MVIFGAHLAPCAPLCRKRGLFAVCPQLKFLAVCSDKGQSILLANTYNLRAHYLCVYVCVRVFVYLAVCF